MSQQVAVTQHRARREVMLWALTLYVAWTVTWLLYRGAMTVWPGALPEHATWWWLGAKVVVWCVPVWVLITRRGQSPLHFLGLDHLRGLGWGAAATLLLLLIEAHIDAAVPGRWPAYPQRPLPSLPSFLVIAFVSPALEEVLFRGYAWRMLMEAGSPSIRANVGAGILFALLHLPGWLFQGHAAMECAALAANVALLGFLFGVVRARECTLWSSILMHIVNNAWHQGWLIYMGELLAERGAT